MSSDPRFPRPPLYGCSGCRQDFGSLQSFDAHRVGKHAYTFSEGVKMEPLREDGRRCLDEEEMLDGGRFVRNAQGRLTLAAPLERARRRRESVVPTAQSPLREAA